MLFGTILTSDAGSEFDFVCRGVTVYPLPEFAYQARKEGESVFACLATPDQVIPPDVISPDNMGGILNIPKAKAILIDKETRNVQSFDKRITFLMFLLELSEKQTQAFASVGAQLNQYPFNDPFAMNSLYIVMRTVVDDLVSSTGLTIEVPKIQVGIRKDPIQSSILGPDGSPMNSEQQKIIC